MCVRFGIFQCAFERQERISKFVNFEWNSLQLIGYLNSDSGLPPFAQNNSSFGTLLHGPLLAKNPALADYFIQQILSNHGLQTSNLGSEALTKIDEVAVRARKVAESMIED
jgi:CobQ-like glutamine amidotransferase family enzyme